MINFEENQDIIFKLIDMISEDEYVIPLYCKIGKKYIPINEIKDIKDTNISKQTFKVAFGTKYCIFNKNSFPMKEMRNFNMLKTFRVFSKELNTDVLYIVFETGIIDDTEENILYAEIRDNVQMLYEYCESLVKTNRINLINQIS